MLSILITVFILSAVHYLYFLLKIFRGLKKVQNTYDGDSSNLFISVIIPFRNEAENLINSLVSIESQTYPKDKFEVIYVNDSSEDDSMKILTGAVKSENIKVISVPADFAVNAHKKRAIRYGIENSTGEIIITTDADCVHGKEWLKVISSVFDADTGFVSGPVKFQDGGTVFGKLQEIEFAGLVLAGAGLIGSGSPTICNAANIAYRRSAFEEVGGFKGQMNLSSGDDELLMQKIHKNTDYKVKFCWNVKALVKTEANKSVNQFYQQRKRWASKGLFYGDKLLILKLILIFLFYLSIPFQIIFTFTWSVIYVFPLFLSLGIKIITEYAVIKRGVSFLLPGQELKYFYLAEIFHIPYIIIAGISGLLGNYTWKKRKIKR